MDIMLYEAFDEEARLLRKMLPGQIVAGFTAQTIQASLDRALPSHLISIRTQSSVPPQWSTGLRGLLTRSEGYDHLINFRRDFKTKAAFGHLSGYCSRAVAEQALMLMFALVRKLPRQMAQLDVFNRDGLTGGEIKGKNALVIGVGKIGQELVRLARGVGLNVKGVDIVKHSRKLTYVSLKQGLAWADVIFCTLPLTSKTEGLLDHETLSRSTRRPFLINVGRGEIVPFEGLIRLLKEHQLAGVAIDVYPDERALSESLRAQMSAASCVKKLRELQSLGNVICTPHNAFNTAEALEGKCRQTIDAVMLFLAKERFPFEV